MKRKFYMCFLLSLMLVLTLCSCTTPGNSDVNGGNNEEQNNGNNPPEEALVINLVRDPKHENGFNVKGQQDGDSSYKGKLWYESEPEESYWDLAQWECGYYLKEDGKYPASHDILKAEKSEENGTYQWRDASKVFQSNPQTGALFLALDASKEYTAPRKNNEPWPHLLLEYSLAENPKVAAMSRLELQLDFELKSFENLMADGNQKNGLHTAQFLWYMTVRNDNPNSEDYGCFMWFGVNLFDRRYEFADMYAMQDTGKPINTGAYIYQPAAKDILPHATAIGVQQNVRVDLLPFIRKAFMSAQNAKFFTRSNFSDLVVGGGNFGWEMTGTYSAAMAVNHFQLVATMN